MVEVVSKILLLGNLSFVMKEYYTNWTLDPNVLCLIYVLASGAEYIV